MSHVTQSTMSFKSSQLTPASLYLHGALDERLTRAIYFLISKLVFFAEVKLWGDILLCFLLLFIGSKKPALSVRISAICKNRLTRLLLSIDSPFTDGWLAYQL